MEKSDFLKTRALRNSIHLRERGHCFYCLHRTDAHTQCLDHVQPRVKAGCNSYRNLVSCCLECNSRKGEQSAPDFFRSLYRDRRLTASEFQAGLRRLDALAAGKLPPPVQHPDIPSAPTPLLRPRSLKPVILSGAGRLSLPRLLLQTSRPAQSKNLSARHLAPRISSAVKVARDVPTPLNFRCRIHPKPWSSFPINSFLATALAMICPRVPGE